MTPLGLVMGPECALQEGGLGPSARLPRGALVGVTGGRVAGQPAVPDHASHQGYPQFLFCPLPLCCGQMGPNLRHL